VLLGGIEGSKLAERMKVEKSVDELMFLSI
jgi:hypothetical protein